MLSVPWEALCGANACEDGETGFFFPLRDVGPHATTPTCPPEAEEAFRRPGCQGRATSAV